MNRFLFWTLGITALYSMLNSRLAYLVSGIALGVNYHEELFPYVKPVQDEVKTRIVTVRDTYFPDVKFPSETTPRNGYETIMNYIKKKIN